MVNAIKIYTAQRMTGRFMDELVVEAHLLTRVLANYGFVALNPVLEEKIPSKHEILPIGEVETLTRYWNRDKEMIREADILLDYETINQSDGVNMELGYARWCLWKPTVRVWSGLGGSISRLEHDLVTPTLTEALQNIQTRWGSYEKLATWRVDIWERSFPRWLSYQQSINERYGLRGLLHSRGL